jgi:dipeptidyl aminopeptidase/acylaminoacyl peptidase
MVLKLRLLPWMLALALVSVAAPAPADPFSVEHLLQNESFGSVQVSPDQGQVLIERQGPYAASDRFDLGYFGRWTTSEVWVADRSDPTRLRPLLGEADRRGVVMGGFSPSGRRLVVHRLQNDRWETGVVELASGAVRWLGLGAEPPIKGETVLWRTEDELILVARLDDDLPYEIGALATGARNSRSWRSTSAAGGLAATVWGAGAFAEDVGRSARLGTWRIDLRSGARRRIAEGQTLDLALSQSGRWLAILDRGPPVRMEAAMRPRPSDAAEKRRLTVLDLTTDAAWRPCGECDVALGLLRWSSDERLLVWERTGAERATDGRLLAIAPDVHGVEPLDLGGIEPEVSPTRDASFLTVRADWFGEHAIILGRHPGDPRPDWRRVGPNPLNLTQGLPSAPGGLEAISATDFLTFADGAVWSVATTGNATRVSGGERLSAVSTLTPWASLRRRVNSARLGDWTLGRAPDGSLWRVSTGGLQQKVAEGSSPDLRAAGEGVAIDVTVDNGVETLRLLQPGQSPAPLAVVNAAYARIEFATPLPVTTPGAPQGFEQSWLYSPPGGLVSETPLIIVAYPEANVRPGANPAVFNTMTNVQLLAGLGYAVLTPALPGTGPDGPSAHLTDRILATLDAALAQYPELDADRVGYVGHSFGGFTGLVLAAETRRIRSFVIMSAPSNLASEWGSFGAFLRQNPEFGHTRLRRNVGWGETGQGGLGGTPWEQPEAYTDNSPFFRADRIDAPVLLIHGEFDFVGINEAEALFTALWRQNKDAQLVTYWGEQHLFYSPGTVRDLWTRLDGWFARTIGRPPARLTPPAFVVPTDGPTPRETPPQGSPPRLPASEGHPPPDSLPSGSGR